MKDSAVFTPGRSNFGLLLSDSEDDVQSNGLNGSEQHEEELQQINESEAAKSTEEDAEEAVEEDEWCPVVGKKEKKASNPAKPKTSFVPSTQPHHHQGHHGKTSFMGNGIKKLHHTPVPTAKLEEIGPNSALELYDFPSKYRNAHLCRLVETVTGGPTGYKFKWQNDQSCWVVFEDGAVLERALAELKDEVIKVRPFDEKNLVITEDAHVAEPTEPADNQ